jgi:aerobic-type carbon monoxide dehydrogenase small subunit (CoxS/CutS family)
MKPIAVSVEVNGARQTCTVPAATRLLDVLRTELGLTGTKSGCDVGECGACTVLLDGQPTLACLVLACEVDGRTVTTIEDAGNARVRALQRAFVAEAGLQCGFCTPGMILAASVLPPNADAATIRAALVGNLCRCTGYTKIVRAIRRVGRAVTDDGVPR